MDVPAPDERGECAVPHVEFVGVDKSYDGRNLVVRGLDLAVERGEFLTLLGPSGSGKPGALATVVIRPERVEVSPRPGRYRNEVETRIDDLIFLGDHLRVRMTVGGCTDFIAKIPNIVGHGAVLPGDTVTVGWAALDCRALVPEELAEGEEEW